MYDVNKIRQAMDEQFLSPRQLAAKAKLAGITVYRFLESGNANPATVGKLVRALSLNPKDVVIARTQEQPIDLPEPKTAQAEHSLVLSARENR